MATPHSPRPESRRSTSEHLENEPLEREVLESKENRTTSAEVRPKPNIIAYGLLGIVHFYRYFISPMLAPRCRFYPTCSQYALDAIRIHGAIKGSGLALKRIARCHPLSAGGDDPVPPKCNCQKSSKSDRL